MIQNDQVNAVEESTLEVDAADGVLANDTAPNGPLSLVEGLYRTTGGGQIYFFSDGSYDYVSAPGYSGADTVQYTAFDSNNNVAGTATLTIDVTASAPLPFVSIGTQLGVRTVVTAGFPEVGNGIDTNAGPPVPLTGGGYVITVFQLAQANGNTEQVQTYDANNNLVGTFDPGTPVHNLLTAALTDGDYVVGWATGDSPTETSQVELFNAAGTVLAGPVTIDVPGGGVGISTIAALPGGGFVALELGDNDQQLYAWSFSAAGVPDSQPYTIGPTNSTRQSLAVLPDGEIVVAQVENNDEVEVQRYDTHGNPIGREILPPSDGNAVDPESTSVTVMPNGGFAVTWESVISVINPIEEVSHTQLVDANGNLVGNQAQTDFTYTALFGVPNPRVAPLANGGFVVSWRGIINNGNTYDGVQVYNASGNAVGGLIEYSDISASGSTFARVFALPGGGFAVGLQGPDPADGNLLIYDNSGDYVGDVPMEYAGDGSDISEMLLANQPDGNTLVLYNELNDTLMSSRATVQTLSLNNGLSTPSIQTGISFNENTTGTIPVVVSLPDPDGSEIVQWIERRGRSVRLDAERRRGNPRVRWVRMESHRRKRRARRGDRSFAHAACEFRWNRGAHGHRARGRHRQRQPEPEYSGHFQCDGRRRNPGAWKHYGRHDHARRQQRQLRDLRSRQQCRFGRRPPGSGRHGVAGCGTWRLLRYRHLGHDPARQ